MKPVLPEERATRRAAAGLQFGRGLATAAALSASMFMANAGTLELGDAALTGGADVTANLAVSLKNPSVSVVGLQFDLVYEDGLASPGIPSLPEDNTEHKLDVRSVEPGRYRVLLFSQMNKPLAAPYAVDLRFGFTEEAPEGGPAMRLENIYLAAEDGSLIPATIAYGPIGNWRNENFTDAQWNDKATGGDSGDADGDGLGNLEEFYFDTDPLSSDGDAVGSIVQGVILPDGSGGKVLRLTWRERKDVRGVAPRLAGGTDPANLTDTVPFDVQSEDDTFRNLKAEAVTSGEPAYFLELQMKREPTP